MKKSDTQLVIEYKDGDEEVFTELVFRYVKIVYNQAYRLSKNKSDAEDISQEVFLKVWKNIKKYKFEYSFKTWILTITRNTSIDWLRKKRNIVFSDFENETGENVFVENIVDQEMLADELFAKIEDAKMLEEFLEKISLNQSEVLRLRYKDDLSFEEIAKVLNKPIDTVKSLHRRALMAIRQLIN